MPIWQSLSGRLNLLVVGTRFRPKTLRFISLLLLPLSQISLCLSMLGWFTFVFALLGKLTRCHCLLINTTPPMNSRGHLVGLPLSIRLARLPPWCKYSQGDLITSKKSMISMDMVPMNQMEHTQQSKTFYFNKLVTNNYHYVCLLNTFLSFQVQVLLWVMLIWEKDHQEDNFLGLMIQYGVMVLLLDMY